MNTAPALATVAALIATITAFLAGYAIAGLPDPPPPAVVEVEVPTGDFDDVPLELRSTTGNTYRYICDMRFAPEGDTAQCDYQE